MKKNGRRTNAWARRSGGVDVLPLLCWCAALVALAFAGGMLLAPGEANAPEADVVISEVMTANAAAWPSESGAFYDWLELWNRSEHSAQLGGCRLADDLDIRGAYLLSDRELAPGERLVLYCTDARADQELCTGFTLNKDGVSLALLNADGGVLDAVKVPALRKGEVYARVGDGDEWEVTREFTPGLENTADAHARLPAREWESGPVRISELMASNAGALKDADGDPSDWIELHNESAEAVRLAGWSLVEGAGGKAWSFPDVALGPNEYMLVFASAKNRTEGELHANFRLNASGETLYLLDAAGRIASTASYDGLDKNASLSRNGEGKFTTALPASPGAENGGSSAANQALTQNPENIYINEVVCSMTGGADWVEFHNAGGENVNLAGWWLSDDAAHPRKWEFPSGLSVAPGGYAVVILGDAAEVSAAQKSLPRADFALNRDGEALVLTRPDGTAADSLELPRQLQDISYGRADGQSGYRYFEQMTPGAANAGNSYAALSGEVEFSVPGGRMRGPVTVELTAEDGAAIYYTTDGTAPGTSSTRYQGPLNISSNTVLRAFAQAGDALPSEVVNSTYIFDDTSARKLVCISGDPGALTSSAGVLSTGSKQKQGVGMEVYTKDGAKLISQNCELMISGHYTTKEDYPQKAIRLRAKRLYGDSKFRAKLFENLPYEEYEAIVLRASGQDSRKAFMRDALLTSLAGDIGLYHQAYEMCVVYVNGAYWGLYYMREHVDPDSICQFEGWDPDAASIDLLEGNNLHTLTGSRESFGEMVQFVTSAGLASDENVEKLRQWCDIENYLDYVAVQMYTEHEDLGNLRVYRNANGDGLWRWVVYDLDLSFLNDKNNVSMWLSDKGRIGSITQQSNVLFYQLMRNDKMRDYFLTRFGELLATTFSAERVSAMVEAQYNDIAEDMKRNTDRWGWKFETWQKRARSMYNYAKNRPGKLMEYLKEGFRLSDEQMQHYFGATLATLNP